jgi:hypothetical protein
MSWPSLQAATSPDAPSAMSYKAAFQNILGIVLSGKLWWMTKRGMLTTRMHVGKYITVGVRNL